MSEIIENTSCPRCNHQECAHIGRDDMGVIRIHVMVCPACYLVWHVTDELSWYGKVGKKKSLAIKKGTDIRLPSDDLTGTPYQSIGRTHRGEGNGDSHHMGN